MLRVHRLREKKWQTESGSDAVVAAAAAREGAPIWVEAIAPDAQECAVLVRQFALRERLLEDALEPLHPPALREFDEHLFLIVHAPETAERKETRKIALFLGDRWLVTVVRAPLPLLEPLFEQLKRHPEYYLSRADFVAEAILDHMAQIFEERVDEMIDQVEAISDEALEDPAEPILPKLHQLRRRASAFTRIVRAQRDVCQALARGGGPFLSGAIEPHLRDVADHMLRIYDLLEAVRDGIVAARDSHLTAVSNQLNATMRTLTAVATILLPLGLVASVFGMNFEAIPLAHDPAGFWILLGTMVTVASTLVFVFRRRGWL